VRLAALAVCLGFSACAEFGVAPGAEHVAAPAASAASAPAAPGAVGAAIPPPTPREVRGAWVATVANIDWPSMPGLSAAALRAEAVALLDHARATGLNALILQVRPAGDAIYPSALEPWSEYLGGAQGRAPWHADEPAWDPLAFWVQEAHARGLELHAWFNPYRARHSSAKSPLAAPHLALAQPALVKAYGDMLWVDPGEPAASAHTLAVVADVLRRYDVDGIHIDDYFYPYPLKRDGADLPFPDDDAYARHRLGGGSLARDDWRRANVDQLVQALQRTAREIKPWVRVGISPFGLGRPELRPAGISGFSQYDRLYADVERWLHNGWLDYLAPQLYWPIERSAQAFPVLLDYWVAQNNVQRHIWPGLFTSQIPRAAAPGAHSDKKEWTARELLDQVAVQRARAGVGGAGGHIHFSMVALMQDRDGIATQLRNGPYAQAALVPATPWLDGTPPPAPLLVRDGARVAITPGAGEAATLWAVWRRSAGAWRFEVLPAAQTHIDIGPVTSTERLSVATVDRVGNLGPATVIDLQ
jgi:uncharacterized lipoprotein YddW (UPF0748 family)